MDNKIIEVFVRKRMSAEDRERLRDPNRVDPIVIDIPPVEKRTYRFKVTDETKEYIRYRVTVDEEPEAYVLGEYHKSLVNDSYFLDREALCAIEVDVRRINAQIVEENAHSGPTEFYKVL